MNPAIPTRSGALVLAHALLAAWLLGCSQGAEPARPEPTAAMGSEMPPDTYGAQPVPSQPLRGAKAELQTAEGIALTGSADFVAEPDGVRARVQIEKAAPGKHGIHVHEKGDCSDIPGKSMGSHFAPDHKEHGLPQSPTRHLGDLGNIEVAADGKGQLEIKVLTATLDDGPRSFAGKALVIHEKEDIGTGPSGESGTPIACGLIEVK
jgi:Cu-Zn family superoxide dismutase